MKRRSKRGGLVAFAVVLSMGAAGSAHAQHVVTEAEAAKLTLQALTAPPPPPRPIYRAFVHRAMARSFVSRSNAWGRHAAWGGRHGGELRVSERHVVHATISHRVHHHRS